MKILFVVSRPIEINSSSSLHNKAIILGLIENGHKVDLMSAMPDKNHDNYDNVLGEMPGVNKKYINLGGSENILKIVRKLKILNPLKEKIHNLHSKKYIYDSLSTLINYIDQVDINDSMYDLVISSSDPKSSHLFVDKLYEKGKLSDTKWLQMWGDPFTSDITLKNTDNIKKIKEEEERLLELPNYIMYVSPLTLEEQQSIFSKQKDKMYWMPVPYEQEKLYKNSELYGESLHFLYAGDYTSHIRDILPLYHAINDSNHKLTICGSTDLNLESTANVEILPRVSQKKVNELTGKADVLVHLSNSKGTQIPAKIYHYSGTNKPIMFILDGNTEFLHDYFSKFNRYVFCYNTLDSLTSALNNFTQKTLEVDTKPIKDFSNIYITNKIIESIKKK